MDLFTLQKHIRELQILFSEKPFVQRVFSGIGRTVNFRLRFKHKVADLSFTLDLPGQGLRLDDSCAETDKNISIVKTLNRLVTNARINSVKCLSDDRVVKIHFVAVDAYFGNRRDYYLVCEFTGRICDIYICDEKLKILDRLGTASNNRIGAVYIPLSPSGVVPPVYMKEAEFRGCSVEDLLGNEEVNSVFLYMFDGKLRAFSVYELKHLAEKPTEVFATVNEALNRIEELRAPARFKEVKERVIASINKELKQKRELFREQFNLKEKYSDGEKMRMIGNLITANIYKIKPSSDWVEVENWETQENVKIELDPSKTPAANAKKYFNLSKKAKRGIVEVEKRIIELENDIKWLEEQLWLANNAFDENDLTIEKNTETGKGQKKQNTDKTREKNKIKAVKPDFETETCMCFVGRSAKQNDFLTFKVAKNEDYWFHAKDVPGAHVILKLKEGEVSEKDVFVGALLAAKNSFAKNSDKVLVEYTKVKNVKRVPKGGLGRVFYVNQKSVLVDPVNNSL